MNLHLVQLILTFKEMKRIFIVGIARSGTTLLQSIVGSHEDICTFPETHFFSNTIPKQYALRLIHKIKPQHQELVKSFFDKNSFQGYSTYHGKPRNMNQWTQYLTKQLDCIAEGKNQSIWLEKTPMHLYYIDLIEKNVENCFFIHTVREPKSTIAALYDVSKKHPQAFQQSSLFKAIERYKREMTISQSYLDRKNHLHVFYEDVVKTPKVVAKKVCKFLELPYSDNILNFQTGVDEMIEKDETWKSNNSKELLLKDKLNERLTPEERKFLEKELTNFRLPLLNRYEKN